MDAFLEIVKITLPALIVFFTVYFLQKEFYKNQLQQAYQKARIDKKDGLFLQKIQAYERLSLFCERIRISQLMIRLRNKDSSADSLGSAMMIAIQQELDHNATQQIFVSHRLWEILVLATQQTQSLIQTAKENTLGNNVDGFIKEIIKLESELEFNPLDKALFAIKEEVKMLS